MLSHPNKTPFTHPQRRKSIHLQGRLPQKICRTLLKIWSGGAKKKSGISESYTPAWRTSLERFAHLFQFFFCSWADASSLSLMRPGVCLQLLPHCRNIPKLAETKNRSCYTLWHFSPNKCVTIYRGIRRLHSNKSTVTRKQKVFAHEPLLLPCNFLFSLNLSTSALEDSR